MKNTNKKNTVYHYEKNKDNKMNNYDNEFAEEFDLLNRPLQLEIEQTRRYTNYKSAKKSKDKTAK